MYLWTLVRAGNDIIRCYQYNNYKLATFAMQYTWNPLFSKHICNFVIFIMMLMLQEFCLFWTVTIDCVSLLYFTSVIRVGGVMVNVLALSGVDSGLEPDRIKPKTITIYICFFFTNHAVLSNKSKIWHVRNYDNVSEWSDMWTDCCFSEKHYNDIIKSVCLVQSEHQYHFIESNLFSPWFSWTIAYLTFGNTHSLTLTAVNKQIYSKLNCTGVFILTFTYAAASITVFTEFTSCLWTLYRHFCKRLSFSYYYCK
jgi:hypothetical protein